MNTRKKPCYNYIKKENGNLAIVYQYEGKNVIIVDNIKTGRLESESRKLEQRFARQKTFDQYEDYIKSLAEKALNRERIDGLVKASTKRFKKFFDKNNLSVKRVDTGTNVVVKNIKNGDVTFYGKVEELEEFIRLANRSKAEKILSYKKVIKWSKTSKAKYTKEKVWVDGSVFKFSKHSIPPPPPICVDFSYTPKVLYGGKVGRPAVVKIKLTGNDEIDFEMAFKKSGLSAEEIKK
jgi:hypothetical protein